MWDVAISGGFTPSCPFSSWKSWYMYALMGSSRHCQGFIFSAVFDRDRDKKDPFKKVLRLEIFSYFNKYFVILRGFLKYNFNKKASKNYKTAFSASHASLEVLTVNFYWTVNYFYWLEMSKFKSYVWLPWRHTSLVFAVRLVLIDCGAFDKN